MKRKLVLLCSILLIGLTAGCSSKDAASETSASVSAASGTAAESGADAADEVADTGSAASAAPEETAENLSAAPSDASEASDAAAAENQPAAAADFSGEDTDALFSNADVEGYISTLSEGSLTVFAITKTEDEATGLIEVSSDDTETTVTYSSDTSFERLEMSRSTEEPVSHTQISQADLKKDDYLLMFGSKQDNGWLIERAIVIVWK